MKNEVCSTSCTHTRSGSHVARAAFCLPEPGRIRAPGPLSLTVRVSQQILVRTRGSGPFRARASFSNLSGREHVRLCDADLKFFEDEDGEEDRVQLILNLYPTPTVDDDVSSEEVFQFSVF
ncbi:hypothetical protein FQA47_002393 [Oryzias melastigma]|uniref:Uncharacterized protein n=1 Tax=Oryzias melastigma TaxID=30732 RepID=A0A834FKC7_ORYME|nr:hypothetical protein FQA47_002393 [Oryzias melastigma]